MMHDSILGDDLSNQKALAFERRFGLILLYIDQVTREKDRDFLNSIGHQIRASGGAFFPADAQGKWLVDIEGRIRDCASVEKLQDKLLEEAEPVCRPSRYPRTESGEGIQLESGKGIQLRALFDAGRERDLTRNELRQLQYLVHAAKGRDIDNFNRSPE